MANCSLISQHYLCFYNQTRELSFLGRIRKFFWEELGKEKDKEHVGLRIIGLKSSNPQGSLNEKTDIFKHSH